MSRVNIWFKGVGLILRLQFEKMLLMLNKISPEFFPTIAQYVRMKGLHSLPSVDALTLA